MDITALYNISSGAIQTAAKNATAGVKTTSNESEDTFGAIFQTALDNINQTNSYLSDAENEELKFAMGLTQNTHDLTISLEKASTALQYTVAVRDRLLEAYKELMQMQI
ncbi:MAG: flagellar hook-basal body complex protein FliE [Lachnospiraceae bacterium]|jgi:flagellar hook-basal body complex protein FliE|nr:flagellar hook-basal body complex protein FliE [Lachnospiraceae bacterium]